MEQRGLVRRQTLAELVLPLVVLAVLALLFWGARQALLPFALGVVLAYALAPAVSLLEARGIAGRSLPRGLAIALLYLSAALVLALLLWFTLPPLFAQVRQLISGAPGYLARIQAGFGGVVAWYQQLDLNPQLRAEIESGVSSLGSSALGVAQGFALGAVAATGRTVSMLFGLLLLPFWVFYLLRDQHELGPQLLRLAPSSWQPTVRDLAVIADQVLGRYLRGQLLLMLAVGLAVLVATTLLGLTVAPTVGSYALLLAVVAGVTEAIPIVGPVLGGAVGVAIAIVDGPSAVLWTLLAYVVVQQLENTLLVPKIMGEALEVRPAVLILALAVGSQVAGILGALLAGPLLALFTLWFRYAQARLRGELPAGTITPKSIAQLRQPANGG
ncbi:MAG: AI-2E family transporter [Chloroflexi bacterium]|nr:AI-2E family transporter [Chloroflexota bacterium]